MICNGSPPFCSFAHKIIKIHFFMNEKSRNHSNFLSRSFPPSSYFSKATLFLLFPFCLGLLEGGQSWQTHLEVVPCLWLWFRELKIYYLYAILNSLRENKWKILSRTTFASIWWGMVCNGKLILAKAFREFLSA